MYDIVSDDTRTLHFVKFTNSQLNEIKRVIEYAELDVKKLSMQKLSNAVMRSFAKNEGDPVPAKGDRYFSGASLEFLVKGIGLNLDRNEICSDAGELVGHAHQIAWVLAETHSRKNADDGRTDAGEYEDILVDCLKLIRCISEIGGAHILQITGAIPSLVKYLDEGDDVVVEEAVATLRNILKDGDAEHRTMVLEAKPNKPLSRLLASSNASIAQAAVLALDNIVAHEGIGKVTSSLDTHTLLVDGLIGLLEGEREECVQSALGVLAIAKKDMTETAIDKGLFAHVVRLMKSSDVDCIVLTKCLVLLRKFLWLRSSHRKRVLDEKLVPRLVELAKTNGVRDVQIELAHVMVNLADATEEEARQSLVSEHGFLPALINLIEFSDCKISVKALTVLGKLAKSWDMMEHGIVPPLLRLLNGASKRAQLRAASKTLAECCRDSMQKPRQKHFDFILGKASMVVVTKLLANNDAKTVVNCCWVLHNMLEGLDEREMSAVISIGFANRLVGLLGKGLAGLEVPAWKSLRMVSAAGRRCIESITDADGLMCIKVALMFGSDDEIRRLACSIVENIVGDAHHIQAVIDANVLPSVLQGLPSKRNALQGLAPTVEMKTLALKIVYKVTETGTASQVKCLVDDGCVKRLCVCLDGDDHDNAIVAMKTLKNLLAVGKVMGTRLNVQSIERKLDEWEDEILRLQREGECLATLREKKAWLEFAAQERHTLSLCSEFGRLKHALKGQLGEQPWLSCDSQLELMSSSHGVAPNPMTCLARALHRIRNRLREAERKLDVLEKIASEPHRRPKWLSDLAQDDHPKELASVNEALDHSISSVLLLEARRSSYQRTLQIDEVELGLEELFMSMMDYEVLESGDKCSQENFEGDSVAGRLKRRKTQSNNK